MNGTAKPCKEATISLDAVSKSDVVFVSFPVLEPSLTRLPVVGPEIVPVLNDEAVFNGVDDVGLLRQLAARPKNFRCRLEY